MRGVDIYPLLIFTSKTRRGIYLPPEISEGKVISFFYFVNMFYLLHQDLHMVRHLGIAVISLDLSSVLHCPKTT